MKWQEHQIKWPTLFKLAMDLIPIQATSVPCEHVFSASKETARARAKNKRELNFTEGLREEDEVAELEAVDIPVEDLRNYLRNLNVQDE